MKRGKKKKLSRDTNLRKVLYKALTTALITYGKIKTTETRAKSLSTHIDKLVMKSLNNNELAMKYLLQFIGKKAAKKLLTEISPKFKERNGGYTKIIKVGQRRSDGSQMALIEFLS